MNNVFARGLEVTLVELRFASLVCLPDRRSRLSRTTIKPPSTHGAKIAHLTGLKLTPTTFLIIIMSADSFFCSRRRIFVRFIVDQ